MKVGPTPASGKARDAMAEALNTSRTKANSNGGTPGLLFVVNDCEFFLSHRVEIAVAALNAGFDVHLAALADGHAAAVERRGIRVHPLPVDRHALNPFSEMRLIVAVARLFRTLRPTIVHNVTVKPVLYGGAMGRLLGIPATVSAVSGTGYLFEDGSVYRRLIRMGLTPLFRYSLGHRNGCVIFQNRNDMERYSASWLTREERAILIPGSGVDLSRFRPRPEPAGAPVILFAGRLLWAKGVGVFAEAARLLRQRRIEARCVLCGVPPAHNRDGVPASQIEDWVRAGDVEWWGHRSDMAEVLAGSHIVSLPSHYGEGLPKILIEAAAVGRPVVTTDWPGCRDAVDHGVTGFLVPIKSPPALADALERLVADPALRRRMGEANRRKAETQFGIEQVISRTLDVYARLMSECERAASPALSTA